MDLKKKRNLVIFDMDGLMFDTELLSHQAWMRTAEVFGFDYSMEITLKKLGLGKQGVRQLFKHYFGEEAPIPEWHAYSHKIKRQLIDQQGKAMIKPGLLELLAFLKKEKIQTAIASSSDREMIDHYLELTEISHPFDYIISGDAVEQSKPNPEIFLKVCKALSVKPEEALVLEDSVSGFKAAQTGGIPLFFVEDLIVPTEEIRAQADGVFKNLNEVLNVLKKEKDFSA